MNITLPTLPSVAIGPMSSETIEAVFRFSHLHRKPLMLIASKNQIDYAGGYVNGWTTEHYMRYVREQKQKYPQSAVLVCRDHCGPGFNGIHDLDDVSATIESDIANGFDLIHIDFCHYRGSREEQRAASHKAIERCLEKNPHIMLEIGTDENAGVNYNLPNLEEIAHEIDFFKAFCNPSFFVVQTGSLVMEINQVGNFNQPFVERVHALVQEKGMRLKEHNADYLSKEEIKLRIGLVDAQNIAPQFGVIQTQLILAKCLMYGIRFDDFINEVHAGKKWGKWLQSHTADNIMLCAMIAGHYHFRGDHYKKIISQLEAREDIHESIINALMDVINHYVND